MCTSTVNHSNSMVAPVAPQCLKLEVPTCRLANINASGSSSSSQLPFLVYSFERFLEYFFSVTASLERSIFPVLRFIGITLPMLIFDLTTFLMTVLILAPGVLRTGWYYFIASNRHGVWYGSESIRQSLDVFPSRSQTQKKGQLSPVLLYFPGGAWIIGSKMWAALLSRTMTVAGITVVVADYRNYPQATVPVQVQDVELAIQWTIDNISKYGGDPANIILSGESAGGHLACMSLLMKVLGGSNSKNSSTVSEPSDDEHKTKGSFKATDFKGFLVISAPNNLGALEETFLKHGWDGSIVNLMFGGQLQAYNPHALVQACASLEGALPPVYIYHASHDRTVPVGGAKAFAKELARAGVQVQLQIYQGWNHSRANVEGPMGGDYSFHRDAFAAIDQLTDYQFDLQFPSDDSPLLRKLCPTTLCRMGSWLIPF